MSKQARLRNGSSGSSVVLARHTQRSVGHALIRRSDSLAHSVSIGGSFAIVYTCRID